MSRVAVTNESKSSEDSAKNFVESVCLPFLLRARNADGGWGYRPGATSATEPTAWSLMALAKTRSQDATIQSGRQWLVRAQNADGSWPTTPDTREGNWVTPLAGLALLCVQGAEAAVKNAGRWVCLSETAERGWRMRIARLLHRKRVVEQDTSLLGWSWTPHTSSWVEPTAVALIFLHHLTYAMGPPEAAERLRMGEALLYDRMCPAGGWNLGNPKVYGVEGIPQVGPTGWALLALQEHSDREENRRSLDWLAANAETMEGPTSLALARLSLEACGRPCDFLDRKLSHQFQMQGFFDSVLGFAQAAVALEPGPDFLRWNGRS